MKAMIKYNRALDYMVEAMNEMVDGKKRAKVAAALMAKAFAEPDALAAIKTIEATNKLAYSQEKAQLEAAQRLQATEEMTDEESEFPVENTAPEAGGEDEFDFDADPLDYVGDEVEEEVPAVAAVTASPKEVKTETTPVATKASVKGGKSVAAEMGEVLSAMVRKRDGK